MTDKFTAGPWSVEAVEYGYDATDDLCILGPSPNFRDIATVARCFNGDRDQEMEQANSRLIAAAPDMLDALRRAVLALAFAAETSPAMQDDYNAVSAAIAKATGANP